MGCKHNEHAFISEDAVIAHGTDEGVRERDEQIENRLLMDHRHGATKAPFDGKG